ncbi:carotenoid biosynthesis protein [Owenweeksia hongkongensis]|nr:carotenoid biosynthesis protein [Owenweeksia hongkongensis]
MNRYIKTYTIPILILFHFIGLIGMVFINLERFAALSIYNLLLSVILIFISHASSQFNFLKLFIPVFVLGYLVELLGIITSFPFGNYHYGEALGFKLYDVPLIIGANWFMLVMGSGFFVRKVISQPWLQVFAGALVMVIVDYPIEHMASTLDYWYWDGNNIPLSNFLGWFFVSIIMQILFVKYMNKETNHLAIPYLIVVSVFFVLLNLFI